MPLVGDGYEILGVSVVNKPPIGIADLELEAGVTALYGLNGAGKTTVLQLIEGGLAGERVGGSVCVHVRVPDPDRTDDTGFIGVLRRALHARLTAMTRTWLGDLAYDEGEIAELEPWERLGMLSTLRSETVGQLTRLLYEARVGSNDVPDVDVWDWMIDDVLADLRVVLVANGSGWSAFLGTTAAPGTKLVRELDAIADYWRRWATGDPDFDFTADMPWILSLWRVPMISLRSVVATQAGRKLSLPRWAAVDLLEVGPIGSFPLVELLQSSAADLDDRTRSIVTLLDDGQRVLIAAADDEVVIHPEVIDTLRLVEADANRYLSTLFEHAPRLTFELGGPEDWLHRRGGWRAVDPWSKATVELGLLSRAQRRYCELAVGLALHAAEDATTPLVFIEDEPESGLHRSAEDHLMSGLTELTVEGRTVVSILATHSGAALNHPRVRPVHVVRDATGHTELRPMPAFTRDQLHTELVTATLGLSPAALLQLIRVFVCVEGLHDQTVLEGLFGDVLDDVRARVVRMSGASNTKAVIDAQLIFQFTAAPVLVVLDNTGADTQAKWDVARAAATAGDERSARRALEELGDADTGEAAWLRELGERAFATGSWGRIHVFGLSMPDIVCYLPSPVADADWGGLIEAWRRSSARPTNIKQWLEREHGTKLSVKTVRSAITQVDSFHPDLVALQSKIQEVASFDA